MLLVRYQSFVVPVLLALSISFRMEQEFKKNIFLVTDFSDFELCSFVLDIRLQKLAGEKEELLSQVK